MFDRAFAYWLGLVVATLASAGCGSAQRPGLAADPPLRQGDPDAPPSLSALPELRKQDSERLHGVLTYARQVLEAKLPPPPQDRSYDALTNWVEADVARWVAARREGVDETRFQFGRSGDGSDEAPLITSAVLGMLHEDTARALVELPSPRELDSEPEIAEMYRELVSAQSEPFIAAARAEYRSCASAAEQGGGADRFAYFCRGRFERLGAAAAGGAVRSSAVAASR